MLGAGIGAAAGQAGHALFKTITGHGDYQVSENAILYNRDAVPKFTSKNPRCTIITHTEFIRDIRGSTSFAVDTLIYLHLIIHYFLGYLKLLKTMSK